MGGKKLFTILTFIIIITTFNVLADNPPKWMDAGSRASLYPSSSYYTGFALGEIEAGESLEKSIERLKQTATLDLTASIRVVVQRVATDSIIEIIDSKSAYSRETLISLSSFSTGKIEIPGIMVETFYDNKKHLVAAFAYVPIKGLAAKLQRQLMMQLSRIEVRQEEAEKYLFSENRRMARESASAAKELLSIVEDTRLTMIALDNSLTEEALMTDEWQAAGLRMIAIESQLNHTVNVYLRCVVEPCDGSQFETMLRGELSKASCVLMDSVTQAEWTIEISVKAEPYNCTHQGQYYSYFSFATADVTIRDAKGVVVLSDGKRVKGAHTLGYEYSTADASRQLAIEVSKIITDKIQQ